MTSAPVPAVVSDNSHPHLGEIATVYISGPMTGLPRFNYPAFRAGTRFLRDMGFEVYCPTERPGEDGSVLDTTGMDGTERLDPSRFDLRAAFADYSHFITTEADAVAVLPGWQRSKGAMGEVMLARAIGLPVIDAFTLDLVDVEQALAVSSTPDPTDPTGRGEPHLFNDGMGPSEHSWATLHASVERHPANGEEPIEDTLARVAADTPQETPPETTPNAPTLTVVHGGQYTPQAGEVRVTSATGGQKGTKEARLDLVPFGPLEELAVLYGRGAVKYDADNWKRGYPWSLSAGALLRHFAKFWRGHDHDEEMGVKEIICVAWHALNLAWFMENRPEFDDRPRTTGAAPVETYDGALPTPQWILDLQAAQQAAKAAEAAQRETGDA